MKKILDDGNTDYYLEVKSPDKEFKEASMKRQFEQRLEQELEKIKAALHRKSGVKAIDKVNRPIGRLAQKYPSAYKYYEIGITTDAKAGRAGQIHFAY